MTDDLLVDRRQEIPRREGLQALALLALILGLAYCDVLFLGKSLVFTDNYNPMDGRPHADNYGANFVPWERWTNRNLLPYANFHDPGATWWQWEPSGVYLREALLAGEMPFWDPYVAGGTPAMANLIPSFFFPPYLTMVLLGNTVFLKNGYFLLLQLSGAFFAWLLLRKAGLSFLPGLLGATVFVLSGAMVQNAGSFIGQAVACLPFVAFMTQRFLARPSWKRGGQMAMGWAAASLASFPPILLGVFGFAALYGTTAIATLEVPTEAVNRRGWFLRFGASAALALGLVGFYYLPFAALARSTPHVAATYKDAGFKRLKPECIYQLLSPVLMGARQLLLSPPIPEPGEGHLPYVGVCAVLLAVVARPRGTRGGRVLFVAVSGATLLVTFKLFGLPPVQWVAALPLLNGIHFSNYFGMVLDFLLAVLAAFGLEAVLAGGVRPRRAAVAIAVVGLATASVRLVADSKGLALHPWAVQWHKHWAVVGLFGLAAGAALVVGLVSPRGRRVAAAGLLLLAAAEGIFNARYPRQYSWDVWRHPVPYVKEILHAAGASRVITSFRPPPNAGSAFRFFSLDSLYPFNPPRVFELYRRYSNVQVEGWRLSDATALPPEPVLDAANVEVISGVEAWPEFLRESERRGHSPFFSNGDVRLLRRKSLPRYFFTSAYRVDSRKEALEAVGRARPEREVVLEEKPGFENEPNRYWDPGVSVRRLRLNSVSLSVDSPRRGLLYCSESFFPGWSARVNGSPARILPANFAFRAVEVPAGAATVELCYWPPGLTAGLVLSLLAAAVVGLSQTGRLDRT